MDNKKQILNILKPKKERKPNIEKLFYIDINDKKKLEKDKLKKKKKKKPKY